MSIGLITIFRHQIRVNIIVTLYTEIMKREIVFYWFVLSIFLTGCSSNQQSDEELPCIDVAKNYPEKEVDLTDIADVSYSYLSTKDEDFLFKGGIDYVTQNTIVIVDRSSNSVLFFSKDGKPESRFNRRGPGPEEYSNANFVMYDEGADEVYIIPDFSDYINVYSSSGEYKRKLTLPQRNIANQMVFFDDQFILVYDNTKLWQNSIKKATGDKTAVTEHVNDSSFYLLSRMDDKVIEYINLPNTNNRIDITTIKQENFYGQINYARVRKSPDGLLLYNPETDTVFLYNKEKNLTPFIHKKPLLSDMNPMITMDMCMDVGRFQFFSVFPYLNGETPAVTYYMRDKKTNEIFRPKIIHPHYKGKEFNFDPRMLTYYEKGYHFEFDVLELKDAYRENKLSGKLKELVAALSEKDDNSVFMFVDFRTL